MSKTARRHCGLVLTRKVDETILLNVGGEEITITVVHVRHTKCRIGVLASPERVIVRRGELAQRPHQAA